MSRIARDLGVTPDELRAAIREAIVPGIVVTVLVLTWLVVAW